MRRIPIWLGAVILVLALAGQSWAQGMISWDACTPTASDNTGEIAVKGSFTLDCGWSLASSTLTITVWIDDCVATTGTVTSCGNNFSGTITGLTSCQTYNVTVEVDLSGPCCQMATIKTDPKQQAVK